MIDYLTYCRVLRIEQHELSAETCAGNVRTVTTGKIVLARIRDLHAEVKFLYKGHEVQRLGAWVGIESAVEQAERASGRFELGPASEGEVRMELRVTERSVSLLRPDSFDTTIKHQYTRETQRAIHALPGHRELVVVNETVWSSKRAAEVNATSVNQALAAFEANGRLPHSCVQEVVDHFQRLAQHNHAGELTVA